MIIRKLDIWCATLHTTYRVSKKKQSYGTVRGGERVVDVRFVMGVFAFCFVNLQITIGQIASYSYIHIVPCLLHEQI